MKVTSKISSINTIEEDESSEYIVTGDSDKFIDFDSFSSNYFTNITPIYSTHSNPTVIYSAIRYGKRFILKGLSESFRDDPIQNLALVKEFEIGISLEHPNIRRTIGFEKVDGLGSVIILEYIDGEPLDKVLQTRQIDSREARSIVNQIASAIEYIHNKQILHRDLKLSNILISHHGLIAKLIDFNLADSESYIVLKNPGGTEKYMAPEQKEGIANASAASDIYSFGMIMKELASASNDSELMRIAKRCSDLNPKKRPQSISDISLPNAEDSPVGLISRIVSSKIFTYILSIICMFLLIVILYNLHQKQIF